MSGSLKLGVVETKMKMEHGGMQRQALRLGTVYVHVYILVCDCKFLMFCSVG